MRCAVLGSGMLRAMLCPITRYGVLLRLGYAMSGTEIRYAATRREAEIQKKLKAQEEDMARRYVPPNQKQFTAFL
eukprot:1788899-Rhodomonas_salina.2